MNLKLALASTLFIALATGCGGSDLDPETGFTDGKICPQSMIFARNIVALDCLPAANISSFSSESYIIESAVQCRDSIESFLDENPNVNCRARDTSTDEEFTIDSTEMRTQLRIMNDALDALN